MNKLTVFLIVVQALCNMIFVINNSGHVRIMFVSIPLCWKAHNKHGGQADRFAKMTAAFLADLSIYLRL